MPADHETDTVRARTKIVAIGASAGGLHPLEEFFSDAPVDQGWCYIVVQHLSPDYRSMMDELLARKTKLRIRHIVDGMALEPDTILLNNPNEMVTVEGDRLRVRPVTKEDGAPALPISALFASLTDRHRNNTVAVILSGSGNDGTQGALAMREKNLTVIAQSPSEAAFSSMPLAAIGAGAVDRVLFGQQMVPAIREIFAGQRGGSFADGGNAPDIVILDLLEERFGIDFACYKPANVMRRIDRRQHLRGISARSDYATLLASDPSALDELYRDLLIGVTQFYRDPEAIASLRSRVLDELAQSPEDPDTPIRIWVPGCASGEEAYTIAIEMSEALIAAGSRRRFRIIATDIHRGSLDRASAGLFPDSALAKVPEELRLRYFEKHATGYAVSQALRQRIIFSIHDVLSDPPFMNLDLISCRNLFIYFNEDAQSRVISMFQFGLSREGYLFLGPSETLGKHANHFRGLDNRWRIYRKQPGEPLTDRLALSQRFRASTRRLHAPLAQRPARGTDPLARPPARTVTPEAPDRTRGRDALLSGYDALLKRYAPSSILLTAEGTVLSWFGAAAAFIDTMNNLADWTVEGIVHPDLQFPMNVAMERLRQGQLRPYRRQIDVDLGGDAPTRCDIEVEALDTQSGPRLMLVKIQVEDTREGSRDTDRTTHLRVVGPDEDADQLADMTLVARRVQELERDLRLTEETLQHVTERLEASGEELQASNEELQASNEELQASNEELQGSNEELHAVNEELVSVSAEHESKIELLSELNESTEMVFQILQVGALFVDEQARIHRFSQLVADWFGLQAHDVNRPLAVVSPRLTFADLPFLVEKVMSEGQPQSVQGSHAGHSLTVDIRPMRASSMPGTDAPDQGAVIIFRAGQAD